MTLHSLLDRDVYRGGAIVVGPVRRGRGRRRARRAPRAAGDGRDENRRIEVFERELWRIAVEHLDYGEQITCGPRWPARASRRPAGAARGRCCTSTAAASSSAAFLLTAVQRNKNAQLRLRALQEIAASRDAEAFDHALDVVGPGRATSSARRVKVVLQALAEKRIGRRDQANAWIWRLAEYTREVHEEYAVQRWPETKRLLGLLVNSSGGAHARNARRLVHAARKQDRRLSAALLAAALAHTPEAEEVLRGARTRMARKPGALSRELLRNFPKGGRRRRGRRRGGGGGGKGGRARPSQKAAAAKRNAPEAPDETVLDEALAPEAMEAAEAGNADAPLEDDAHETLEHQVADTLEEVLEESLDGHGPGRLGRSGCGQRVARLRGSDPLSGA